MIEPESDLSPAVLVIRQFDMIATELLKTAKAARRKGKFAIACDAYQMASQVIVTAAAFRMMPSGEDLPSRANRMDIPVWSEEDEGN